MPKILPFHRLLRSWRRDDPNAEQIRIGEGTATRASVTITIVIPTPFAPEVLVRDETSVAASQFGGSNTTEPIRMPERPDLSKNRHAKAADDWKSATRGGHQWSRHAHRIPTKDLTVPAAIDDTAVDRIAAK